MTDLLPRIAGLWKERREELIQSAESILAAIREAERPTIRRGISEEIRDGRAHARRVAAGRRDPCAGATRSWRPASTPYKAGLVAPPNSRPHNQFLFLLRYYDRSGVPQSLKMVEKTLRSMRYGGIFDQVGFGFHRYSTDSRWLLPHFEKMLYDQGAPRHGVHGGSGR